MAGIIWQDVVDFAAELSTLPVAAQTAILAHVNTALEVSLFGGEDAPKLRLARIYLAAHNGTLAKRTGGASGQVTSSSAGRLSRSFSTTSSSGGANGTTSYGDLYDALVKTTAARLGTTS